jgi:hypothetical protein
MARPSVFESVRLHATGRSVSEHTIAVRREANWNTYSSDSLAIRFINTVVHLISLVFSRSCLSRSIPINGVPSKGNAVLARIHSQKP